MDFRRLPEMLRAAPWRTPPELAVQAALGPSMEVAVLLRERWLGVPASFCAMTIPVSTTLKGNPCQGNAVALGAGRLSHNQVDGLAGYITLAIWCDTGYLQMRVPC